MAPITVTQVRAAIDAQRVKLSRQQAAVDATLALIAMLEIQLDELQKPASKAR